MIYENIERLVGRVEVVVMELIKYISSRRVLNKIIQLYSVAQV